MGYAVMAFVLGVSGYTMVYAWDAWQAQNRLGAMGLAVLTLITAALSFWELFLR